MGAVDGNLAPAADGSVGGAGRGTFQPRGGGGGGHTTLPVPAVLGGSLARWWAPAAAPLSRVVLILFTGLRYSSLSFAVNSTNLSLLRSLIHDDDDEVPFS
jgi:hypothetical protein